MTNSGETLPSFFEAIEQGDEASCRALWLSVILQQILDARGKFGNDVTQRQAILWLEARHGVRSDFAEVCRLAGVDFLKTQRRCAEVLADDSITLDFRSKKPDQSQKPAAASRKRYFRRVERNKRIRTEKAQLANRFRILAANDNVPVPSNDNFINATEENKRDE